MGRVMGRSERTQGGTGAARWGLLALALSVALAATGCTDEGCKINGDCPTGQMCVAGRCEAEPAPGPVCQSGKPACKSGDDCTSGRCEQNCCLATCASVLDCAQGEECRAGVCRPHEETGGCATNSDCVGTPATPYCLVASSTCVGCLADGDCHDAAQTCGDDHRCHLVPGRCGSNADCAGTPSAPVCDGAQKRCVRCVVESDCGDHERCTAQHTCEARPPGCDYDRDCTSTPATPYCDVPSRACVACASEQHCQGNPAGSHCRPSTHACVQCLQNGDCPSGSRCLSDGSCGGATACAAATDCASPTRVCLAAARTCVECAADGDCGAGKRCSQNLCLPAQNGCAQESDCSGALAHCRTSDRTCVACLARSDCGPLQTCSNNACVAAACTSDAECASVDASKPRCSTSGACVACTADAQCGTGKVCKNNACQLAGCGADADCASTPATPRCRTSDRTCVACTADAQCGTGKVCKSNACVLAGCGSDAECSSTPSTPYCRTTDRACVACTADAQCGTGKVCRNNSCQLSGCSSDEECAATPSTPRCNTTTRACVACLGSPDCTRGSTCTSAGVCQPIAGLDQPCGTNGSCASGLVCVSNGSTNTCRAACSVYASDPKCASDRRCTFVGFDAQGATLGACVPAVPAGGGVGAACNNSSSPCDANLVCIPTSATGGVCRRYCDPASSSNGCSSPNACQRLVALDGNDVPRTYGVCFPDTRYLDPCTSDQSCDSGQVCAAGADRSQPTELTNVCDWPVGSKGALAACATDRECKSGFCLRNGPNASPYTASLPGYCQQGCAADAQCPSANGKPGACVGYPFLWSDAQGNPTIDQVPSCVPQCLSDFNCRGIDTCELVANNTATAWATRCRATSSQGIKFGGEQCSSDGECFSGTCLRFGSATDGFCLGTCGASFDCATGTTCPTGGVWQKVGPGNDGVNGTADDRYAAAPICWGKSCLRDGDCAGLSKDPATPRVCGADTNPANTSDIRLSCRPRWGTRLGGDYCQQDAECATGWCVSWYNVNNPSATSKRCFGGCQAKSDCTSATTQLDCAQPQGWSAKVCVPTF